MGGGEWRTVRSARIWRRYPHSVGRYSTAHPPAYVETEGFHFTLNIFIALYQGELWARIWVGCGIKPPSPCQDPEHKVSLCATISFCCCEE